MGHFTAPLRTEQVGPERWRVIDGFAFVSDTGLVISVEDGQETDFASVPSVFQSIVPRVGYYSQAAVVHDKQYREHRLGITPTVVVSREQADKLLLEGMKWSAKQWNVRDEDRKDALIFGGVSIWGERSWETALEKVARKKEFNDRFDNSHIIG